MFLNLQDGEENTFNLKVVIPMLRISLRCPTSQYPQRSGIVVADIHDLCIATGPTPGKRSTRFANESSSTLHGDISGDSVQLSVQFQRGVLASSTIGTTSTTAFASFGSLKDIPDDHFQDQRPPMLPCIQLVRADANKVATMMALDVNIPAVYVDISKRCLDGLQYFADDLGQFLERMSGSNIDGVDGKIQDSKLIGSRFFAKSRTGSLTSSVADTAEMVVKLTLTEGKSMIFVWQMSMV
jgi:autophagy-related protein 2